MSAMLVRLPITYASHQVMADSVNQRTHTCSLITIQASVCEIFTFALAKFLLNAAYSLSQLP